MADKTPDGEECNLFLFTYIQLHGIFMFIGWGILLQLGMFIARYFRHKDPLWFKIHRILQVIKCQTLSLICKLKCSNLNSLYYIQ